MSIIYRYLRPKYYVFNRNEIKVSSKGGVCFRLQTNDFNKLMFATYSVCHPDEVFSKEVSQRITTRRAEAGVGFLIQDQTRISTQDICDTMIQYAKEDKESKRDRSIRDLYAGPDLQTLSLRIHEIWATERAACHLKMLDHEVIEALNLKKMYENH